jgi:hypothetical protein
MKSIACFLSYVESRQGERHESKRDMSKKEERGGGVRVCNSSVYMTKVQCENVTVKLVVYN